MNLQTIRTVAQELGVTESAVRKAVSAGRLSSLPLGNRMLVDMDAAREALKPIKKGLTIKELSQQTGLTVAGIRRGIREGWIPCIKEGRAFTFQLDDVLDAIKKRMDENR